MMAAAPTNYDWDLTCGTSGVRAWLDYSVDGMPMGAAYASKAAQASATFTLAVGLTITRVELWSARAGDAASQWTLEDSANPSAETYSSTVALQNPVAAGAPPEEHVYYLRAFLSTPVMAGTATVDEEVYSSPIWITWSR